MYSLLVQYMKRLHKIWMHCFMLWSSWNGHHHIFYQTNFRYTFR